MMVLALLWIAVGVAADEGTDLNSDSPTSTVESPTTPIANGARIFTNARRSHVQQTDPQSQSSQTPPVVTIQSTTSQTPVVTIQSTTPQTPAIAIQAATSQSSGIANTDSVQSIGIATTDASQSPGIPVQPDSPVNAPVLDIQPVIQSVFHPQLSSPAAESITPSNDAPQVHPFVNPSNAGTSTSTPSLPSPITPSAPAVRPSVPTINNQPWSETQVLSSPSNDLVNGMHETAKGGGQNQFGKRTTSSSGTMHSNSFSGALFVSLLLYMI